MVSAITSMQSDQIFWTLIAVGVFTGICSIIFISIMSSWAMKETLDKIIPVLIFSVIAGTSVYAIKNMIAQTSQKTEASSSMKITDLNVKETGLVTEVLFRTSTPTHAYLEYTTSSGEVIPILSAQSAEKITDHRFVTDRPVGKEGILFVVVDGSKYPVAK